MKSRSKVAGFIFATAIIALAVPSEAAWSMSKHCTGKGWHMVSKKCHIKPAETWQQYDSGVYTQPITGKLF